MDDTHTGENRGGRDRSDAPTRHPAEALAELDPADAPQVAEDQQMLRQLADEGDPPGFLRRHYCLRCQLIWNSLQLPVDFVQELLGTREQVDQLQREIALLRYLLANPAAPGTTRSAA